MTNVSETFSGYGMCAFSPRYHSTYLISDDNLYAGVPNDLRGTSTVLQKRRASPEQDIEFLQVIRNVYVRESTQLHL